MTTQDQTFRAYYSSMTDSDLLKLAANKSSFIDVAKRIMADELARRHLSLPVEPPPTVAVPPRRSIPKALAKLTIAK
jgi:hypothetical protein